MVASFSTLATRRRSVRRLAVLLMCACALPVSAARAWTWPVDGPVLRPFSFDHAHPYAGGQHRGVDLGAPGGAQVLAPAAGVVSFAGTVPTGGKTVSIETPLGYTATLVHLGSIGVKRGARVGEGSVVGTVGPSGVPDLAEPYVYFGLRTTSDQQGYVDPMIVLPPRTLSSSATTADAPAVTAVVPAASTAEASAPEPGVAAATAVTADAPAESAAGSPAATGPGGLPGCSAAGSPACQRTRRAVGDWGCGGGPADVARRCPRGSGSSPSPSRGRGESQAGPGKGRAAARRKSIVATPPTPVGRREPPQPGGGRLLARPPARRRASVSARRGNDATGSSEGRRAFVDLCCCCWRAGRDPRPLLRVATSFGEKGGSYHVPPRHGARSCPRAQRRRKFWWPRPGRTRPGGDTWDMWWGSQSRRTSSRGTTA